MEKYFNLNESGSFDFGYARCEGIELVEKRPATYLWLNPERAEQGTLHILTQGEVFVPNGKGLSDVVLTNPQTSYCGEFGNWLGLGYENKHYGKLVFEELRFNNVQEQYYMYCIWKK